MVILSFSKSLRTDTKVFLTRERATAYLDHRLRVFCENYANIVRLDEFGDPRAAAYQDPRNPGKMRPGLTTKEICELTRLFVKDDMHWVVENKRVQL